MIDAFLKKYIPRLLRKMHREFKVPVCKQEELLSSIPTPRSDVERAYNQYICQKLFWGGFYYFCANIAAFFLLPYKYHCLKKKAHCTVLSDQKYKYVLVADEMPEGIFPSSILEDKNYIRVGSMDHFFLDDRDVSFYEKIKKKYRRHPYFLYKCLLKQAGYSYIIHHYNPEVVVACGAEVTFTAAYLTSYCHYKNVEHNNTMHGEMFYYVLDAYGSFDKFYVWDEYYITLLKSLNVRADFKVEQPKSVKIDFSNVVVTDLPKYQYKYYLQMQDGKVLQNIADTLNRLQNKGVSVCVRYHPRTINLPEIKRLMPDIPLENPREVTIEQSIATSENIVGLNSTVLFQAYTSGRNVIIDDISNKVIFTKLKEMKYILIDKCEYLSNVE